MQLSTLRDEVQVLLQDTSILDASIDSTVNEVIQEVSNLPGIVLSGLKTVFNVLTTESQNYTTLSSTVQQKILYAASSAAPKTALRVASVLEELYENYGDITEEGDVHTIVLEGNVLWYTKVPAVVATLICVGYSVHPTLTEDTDTTEHIPAGFHRNILIHGTASKMYELIEDGMEEEEKTNTIHHTAKYGQGIQQLREWLGSKRKHKMRNPYNV